MKIQDPFSLRASSTFKLKSHPTSMDIDLSKAELQEGMRSRGEELSRIQDVMYAHNRYSVLIILQGMDTAGKDSLIREVFSQMNPRGLVIHSFKAPSSSELQHDYLWRHMVALPEKGKFAVFNRSHYENVLVTRVNPELLLKENIPGMSKLEDLPGDFWSNRLEQIRNFESHLVQNGTIVLKFFLNMGKEEQRKRLLRRLQTPRHQWKFNPGDVAERAHWDQYQTNYEEAIRATDGDLTPWYIIPADDKTTARFLVSDILLQTLQQYSDIREPDLQAEIRKHLDHYIALLSKKEI